MAGSQDPMWYRRIIPEGYETATFTLTGISPLLMSSAEADPESDLFRSFELLKSKNKRSRDDDKRLQELEWKLRLYLDADVGPYIPGRNIKAMLHSAATNWKQGENIKRSLVVVEQRIPLIYDGPRDEKGLWADGFRYLTMVVNSGRNAGRVYRCRPMFRQWRLEAELAFDPEEVDFHKLEAIAMRTQKYGLGDYRPAGTKGHGGDFGMFLASLTRGLTDKSESNGSAIKARDAVEDQAHKAFKSRILVKR